MFDSNAVGMNSFSLYFLGGTIMEQRHAACISFMDRIKGVLEYAGYQFAKLLVQHPKFALYGGLSLMIIAVISIFTIQPNPSVSAHSDHENTKYYTTIQIEAGDTLWGIADAYITPEYASLQDYIDEVQSINHISENEITAGCYITIPYYAETPME
jgi:hypothetical protein